MSDDTLSRLAATIAARKGADPESSWTAKLLAKGPEKCAEKFGEEAIEAIVEAVRGDRDRLTSEAADVLYHLPSHEPRKNRPTTEGTLPIFTTICSASAP